MCFWVLCKIHLCILTAHTRLSSYINIQLMFVLSVRTLRHIVFVLYIRLHIISVCVCVRVGMRVCVCALCDVAACCVYSFVCNECL